MNYTKQAIFTIYKQNMNYSEDTDCNGHFTEKDLKLIDSYIINKDIFK